MKLKLKKREYTHCFKLLGDHPEPEQDAKGKRSPDEDDLLPTFVDVKPTSGNAA